MPARSEVASAVLLCWTTMVATGVLVFMLPFYVFFRQEVFTELSVGGRWRRAAGRVYPAICERASLAAEGGRVRVGVRSKSASRWRVLGLL